MRPTLLASVLAGLVLCACQGRQRSQVTGAVAHDEPRAGPAIVVLDLSDGVPEEPPAGLLGLPSKAASFHELVHVMRRLEREKELRAVLVRLGSARIGLARAQEIGAMLQTLAARVPIWCHADDLSNDTLYLVEQGCKRIWMSPAGSVDAIGLAAQTVYFHKLLAEEIGISVDFLQVGKFKGAEEPFTRDGPSPEARASLEGTLADLRATWLDGIKRARPSLSDVAPEDGPYGVLEAKGLGLIDEAGYFDEARDALEKEAGAVRAEVRVGAGSSSGGGDELADLLRTVAGESLGSAPIALVRANGAISMDGGGGLIGETGGIVERRLVRTLLRLEQDEDVKAVVLRIDSPGGSALASDLLWHELMRIRARKPLVVSVGGMAASGGYYLASAGTTVFAEGGSIVGSIGVVGGKLAIDHALERIGVHSETIPARVGEPGAAARAGYESLLMPWDDATRERVLGTMTAIYDLFVARVAEGRGLPAERVASSAEGRIFSGGQAKARGLVDELGGLTDAIARARTLASLPVDARVTVAGESSGLLDALGEEDPPEGHSPAPSALREGLARVTPELAQLVASLAPLASTEGRHENAVCALPFALTVR